VRALDVDGLSALRCCGTRASATRRDGADGAPRRISGTWALRGRLGGRCDAPRSRCVGALLDPDRVVARGTTGTPARRAELKRGMDGLLT
jgi:hypothetical protein